MPSSATWWKNITVSKASNPAAHAVVRVKPRDGAAGVAPALRVRGVVFAMRSGASGPEPEGALDHAHHPRRGPRPVVRPGQRATGHAVDARVEGAAHGLGHLGWAGGELEG